MSFQPGETVGQYRIIEPLGQGGMATVYKAYHAALDRYVAIKVLHPAFKQDPNFLARFNREARIVAKLDHPNIVPIYDFAEHEGTPYLVMRYIEGRTLKTIIHEGLIPVERVISIIRPVAEGLAYAHAQGILHRDIKPSNIIIANDNHIYITDFGLARIAQAGDSTLSQDMLIGTPQYISPEQARGDTATARSDIYSLGVVLFEMFTGRVPFSADTPYAVIHDHIFTPLPLPTSINPNLAPDIERVLLKTLAKDPEARYTSAIDLINALDQATQVAPVVATPPAPAVVPPAPAIATPTPTPKPTPAKPKQGINKFVLIGIGVLVLVLIAGGALAIVLHNNPARNPRPPAPSDQVRVAREMVRKNPNDVGAHLALADALAANKNYDEAYGEYERAMELDPKNPDPYLHAGALATGADDLDRASRYYKRGLAQLPDSIPLLLHHADVLMGQKKYDDARTQIERVLKLEPNNAAAIWRLGENYRVQGRTVDALREFTRALTIDPNLPEAHFGLGMLAVNRGAIDEAKRQFQIVVNNPNAPPDLKEQANQQLRQLGGQ